MRFISALLVILLFSGASPAQASFWKNACEQLFGRVSAAHEVPRELRFESGSSYRTTPMRARYQGENSTGDIYSAKYFRQQSREQFEVGVDAEGRMRWKSGALVNTCYPATADCPAALFVMDEKGKIYVYSGDRLTKELESIHHSSLLAGGPVSSAGEIFVKEGLPVGINDRSGHYLPAPDIFRQVLDELRSRGVELRNTQVSTH
jgi:hypothetical protein